MLKSILTNTVAQLAAKFFAALLTLLTTVMIVRHGGTDLFGNLIKSLSLIAIGFTAIDFGLNAEAVRSMNGSLRNQAQITRQVFVARFVLSIVAVIITNAIILLLPGGYTFEIKSVFWVGSLSIIFQGLFTSGNAWFQRQLEYWKSSLITIVGSTISAVLTYFVILRSPTLFNLLVSSTVGYGVMAILTFVLLPRAIFGAVPTTISSVVKLFYRSLGLGTILIFSVIASKTDSIILGIFRDSSEVGQYGFAYRIFDVLLVIPTFAMNSIYPLLVGRTVFEKNKLIQKSSVTLCLLGVICAAFAYAFAPLVSLVRPGMNQAVESLRILSLSLPLFYLTSPRMWQLIEERREWWLVTIYAGAALANGFANYLLVPEYGATASAWITGLTELIVLIALYSTQVPFLTKTNRS